MDNDATRVFTPENESGERAANRKQADSKAKSEVAKKAAAAGAGIVAGTGAAFAGERIYDHFSRNDAEVKEEAEEKEEEMQEEEIQEEVKEEAGSESHESHASHHAAQPTVEHVVVEHHVYTEQPAPAQQPTTGGQPAQQHAVPAEDHTGHAPASHPTATPAVHDIPDGDGDGIEVLDVVVEDNGMGGTTMTAAMEVDGMDALVVDVDTDGYVDILAVDVNGNGHFEEEEISILEDGELETADVLVEYVEDSQARGEMAVITDIDTGEQAQIVETGEGYQLTSLEAPADVNGLPDYSYPADDDVMPDNSYLADNDMPDYMNDADMGIYEA